MIEQHPISFDRTQPDKELSSKEGQQFVTKRVGKSAKWLTAIDEHGKTYYYHMDTRFGTHLHYSDFIIKFKELVYDFFVFYGLSVFKQNNSNFPIRSKVIFTLESGEN